MTNIKKIAAAAAVATLALAATGLSASAQSALTNGPTGTQPNTLSSDDPTGPQGNAPRRAMAHRKAPRAVAADAQHSRYSDRRPLTVRRRIAAAEAPVVVTPQPAFNAGPGAIVTGPLGFASAVVSLPFRVIGGIFPASGDIGTNPLVLIGAPLHAVGDIVQIPFRIIGAPFGGTTASTF